ncbi:hypothetical protein PR048_009480 [Dryococelus australis]|uniref:Uncharacterized protein n=1 Tax=Dryococelus australis TaxID=614101 RepID=A0ABQ9I141_9NEOP|nr:hypothetical protein PR048_009480 [Dryococelus australis]
MNITRVRVCASVLLPCVRENDMLQASASREEQLMPPRVVLYRAAVVSRAPLPCSVSRSADNGLLCILSRRIAEVKVMFNRILLLCTALVTMTSIVTMEGTRSIGRLEHENSDFKRQVASTPVNLNGDRSNLSGTAVMHVRNFMLLHTIPVFSGKLEDNVRVFFIKIEQAANVCSWSENEQLTFAKLRHASETLDFVHADSACQEAESYEELKKHLKHTTRFYREQLSRHKIWTMNRWRNLRTGYAKLMLTL